MEQVINVIPIVKIYCVIAINGNHKMYKLNQDEKGYGINHKMFQVNPIPLKNKKIKIIGTEMMQLTNPLVAVDNGKISLGK